jgi:hypothetical protein
MNDKPTRADGCERMLRILSDAPMEGLSLDEIQAITAGQGDKLSLRSINDILCDLMGQTQHEKVRTRNGSKVTKYRLKQKD